MSTRKFSSMGIRTAVVRDEFKGYVLAYDPALEEKEDFCTFVYTWDRGSLRGGARNFFAHSACISTVPELALVLLAGSGRAGVTSYTRKHVGNILEEGHPRPTEPRYGDFCSVRTIAGKAHAVGHTGLVYRMDDIGVWTRIDESLSRSVDLEASDGFSADDIYAVGRLGEIWHFDGKSWTRCQSPTNSYLTSVVCGGDGFVYVTGHGGTILRGRGTAWSIIAKDETGDHLWSIEWFYNTVYLSSLRAIFRLDGNLLEEVNFGGDKPRTCYQLSVADSVMWSVGEKDIMSFDGMKWTRIL